MTLPVDTLLQGGKYRIVRFISSGGFGCTYEAEHVMLEKRVAIKEFFVKDFCNRDQTTSHVSVGTVSKRALVDKLRCKFADEAKALCKLKHPGIVRVSDVFEENGTAYYVMDYVDGLSLGEMVNRGGAMPEARAVRYIRQVAEALRYVHDHNRLHLDIKPGNIMIDSDDNAILIDFGASKQYDEEAGENTSTLMGKTPGYAPLEQMGNDVVKFLPATDIYALGATLYKLLTGITPPSANLLANGEQLAPLPETVSAATRNAIAAAMDIKSRRPQTIDAFLALLDAAPQEAAVVPAVDPEKTAFDHDRIATAISAQSAGWPNKPQNAGTKPTQRKSFRSRHRGLIIAVCVAVFVVAGFIMFRTMGGGSGKRPSVATEFADKVSNDTLAVAYMPDSMPPEQQLHETELAAQQRCGAEEKRKREETAQKQREEEAAAQQAADFKPTGTHYGHDYVDLGLSVKWATCNVGASSPSAYGNYYAWGETTTKSTYVDSKTDGKDIGDIAGNPSYDAARANWGGSWRMPTEAEMQELVNKCTWTWTTQGGHNGYKVTSKTNGNSIFLPAAGFRNRSSLYSAGIEAEYWSSTPNGSDMRDAHDFRFHSVGYGIAWCGRHVGQSVRPVFGVDPVNNTASTAAPEPKPTTGTIAGHDYVDLGLSVKWATCNVGASSPSAYGNYYAWGETTTKSEYTSANCKTWEKSIGDIAGNPAYDAARANWGGSWRMPTKAEMKELINKCTWTWTSQGGHNGYKVTSKTNGNSIFLPAAGWRGRLSLYYAGERGYYWSSSPYESSTQRAYGPDFDSGYCGTDWYYRYDGQSVRPVSE
ncbi:MAG: protein kinase [Alistipes sp.]|nr:protein kinase [Alistipes sp.]MBP3456423.1 protein kinase [Alistipes sp.]